MSGDKILVVGGIPAGEPRGSNFLKIHAVQESAKQLRKV
jgi:hypothetical protein